MIFWVMPDYAKQTQDLMDSFLKSFREENPDITIDIRVINRRTLWSRIFTLKNRADYDEAPDIMAFPHYWTELLVRMGVLENLTEMDKTIRVDDCLDPLKPHSYKRDTLDIYSIPWWFDVSALHYREDHLKLITNEPEKLLSTWPGLLQACAALKERFSNVEEYEPLQNSDWRGTLSNRGALPCLWSRGAYLMDETGQKSGFLEPAFEQGLEDYIELALKGYMPILRERSSTGNIVSGRASIVITRRQGISMFEAGQHGFPVKTLSIPRTGADYANYLGGVSLGVMKSSAEKKNALKLLKWISGAENQFKYAGHTEVFPAKESSFESFLFASPRRIQDYTDIIAHSAPMPNHMAAGTLMEILAELFSSVSTAVVRGAYSKDFLKSELVKAGQEADRTLRLYGG